MGLAQPAALEMGTDAQADTYCLAGSGLTRETLVIARSAATKRSKACNVASGLLRLARMTKPAALAKLPVVLRNFEQLENRSQIAALDPSAGCVARLGLRIIGHTPSCRLQHRNIVGTI